MPILCAEPNCFPERLLDDQPPPPVEGRRWRVLHTRPRQEKSLARQLLDYQVPFYLPLVPRRSLIRGRFVTAYLPLFTSYCFVLASDKERVRVLTTHRIVHALEVPEQARLWEDLRQVHKLIATGAPLTPEGRLVPGTPIEIRTGALAGLRGVILRSANQRRFVVQVDFIQRGASIELDDFMLAKVD